MKLDYYQQQRYSPNKFQLYIEIGGEKFRDLDYLELDNIIRDISFVRHQSSNFSFLYAAQFRFDQMLTLPYWDFLFLKGDIDNKQLEDIQNGCLLIIALLFIEIFDETGGAYIFSGNIIDQIDDRLNLFAPVVQKQKEAVEKIKFLRRYIVNDRVLRQEQPDSESIKVEQTISECNFWLYNEFVMQYFLTIAQSFEIERQKNAEIMKQLSKKR